MTAKLVTRDTTGVNELLTQLIIAGCLRLYGVYMKIVTY
jgi:hypothetical protein